MHSQAKIRENECICGKFSYSDSITFAKTPSRLPHGEDKLNALVNLGKKVEKEVLGDVG